MKLHLGCGCRNFGEDWVHIDGGDYEHLNHNDIKKLPYKDESVDLIYASHAFEYFDKDEAEEVLKEWKRVLCSGGTLRLAVPDFKSMTSLYLDGKSLNSFIGPLYGKMKMKDKTIYHKTVYDFETLSELLSNNGFENIQPYDWKETEHSHHDDHSQAYIPHMDKENGTLISLNVESKKI